MSDMLDEARRRVAAIRASEPPAFRSGVLNGIRDSGVMDLEAAMKAQEARNPRFYEWDGAVGVYRVYWGGYDYEVDYDRLKTPEQLLGWIAHIGAKEWPLATAERLSRFTESVARRRGWDIWA